MTIQGWPEIVGWAAGMWFVIRPLGVAWARRAAAGISAAGKARLTQGFEALGPERVARGLRASGHDWQDCFLARALGGESGGTTRRERARHGRHGPGLGPRVIRQLVGGWDRHELAFRDLATEWLEEARMPEPGRRHQAATTNVLSHGRNAT